MPAPSNALIPNPSPIAEQWEKGVAKRMHLSRDFFSQDTLTVARLLLGKRLVRRLDGHRLAGRIVEAEAYIGEEDKGCHASVGRTQRNEVMFGPPGHAYVYFTYGMHWMFNVVTEPEGFPAAVLIRALEPVEGIAIMARNRHGRDGVNLCSGPAKLTQALGITRALNGADLCARRGAELWIEDATPIPAAQIAAGPRIGLNNTPEPWKSIPWRFYVRDSLFVSKRAR
jgi:DNA-3-methyladenine glycosylase